MCICNFKKNQMSNKFVCGPEELDCEKYLNYGQ